MGKITINNLSNSGIDVESLINKLVAIKQQPIDNLKNTNDTLNKKIDKIDEFTDLLKKLQDASKSLYDYRSPFNEMKATSSDENILTAKASRNADISDRKIKVIQLAKSEKFLSDILDSKTKIGKIAFSITSGKKTKKIIFNGGTIVDFVNAIKKQAGDIVNANLIYKDKNSLYVAFESTNEGIENKLQFSKEIMPILEKLGLFTKSTKKMTDFFLKDFNLNPSDGNIVNNNNMIFKSESSLAIDLDNKLKDADNIKISFNVAKEAKTQKIPESLNLDENAIAPDEINFNNIDLTADTIQKNQIVEQQNIKHGPLKIVVKGTTGSKEILLNGDESNFTIDKSKLGIGDIKEISIKNDTSDTFTISNFKVTKEIKSKGWSPKNLVQKARDAIIEVDGVRLEKSTNKIDDVIKGVTLELKKESDKEISLKIDHDYDYIKDQIIQWVGHYNNVISYIMKETDTTKGADGKPKGTFVGDIAFMMLHNSLQKDVTNYYSNNTDFSMLAQIGISTGKPGSTPSEKGGYLEIDEDLLDKALRENPDKIKKLFGFDSDNDKIPDNGVGVKLYTLINGMTNIADGTFKQRKLYFQQQIDNNKKNIETLQRRLEDYRDQLIYKFSMMEQMVSSLKAQGNYLQNYFGQSQSSQNKQ